MAQPFYLDKRNGKLAGVCAGIAQHFNIDVTVVRIATVLGTILLWGGLALLYVLIAWIADAGPRY
jgi:phage shock protein C